MRNPHLIFRAILLLGLMLTPYSLSGREPVREDGESLPEYDEGLLEAGGDPREALKT